MSEHRIDPSEPKPLSEEETTPTEKTLLSEETSLEEITTPAEKENGGISEKTFDRAAKLLAFKPRTAHELRQRLQEKGVSREEAAACVVQLEEYHLVDDAEYCRMYIEAMLERGRGLARIRRELRQKGVDANVIEDSMLLIEEMPEESETCLQQARQILEMQMSTRTSRLLELDYAGRQKLKGRIVRRLVRQGFAQEDVYRAVQKAFEERLETEKSEI